MPVNRLLVSVCDQSGCSLRAASMERGHPAGEPALRGRLVVRGELAVGGEQAEHRRGVAQVALGEVVLGGADDRRGDEVSAARRDLLD
jgi:hypothetical protein